MERISGIIEEKIHRFDADLVEVEYRREDGDRYLRVFIDRETGVDLDLCSSVSRVVKDIVDAAGIDYAHLEVSSPGINRKLKSDGDFQRYQGEQVKVKLTRDFDGPRTIIGTLNGFSDKMLQVESEQGILNLPRSEITVVRLHPHL